MKNQVTNPYLPLYEYVPDGEPRVFGDRLYIYGSHDRFKGEFYCVNDYVCWSTPVDDLSQWRFDGYIYHKDQDPYVAKGTKSPFTKDHKPSMFAPDVVQGADGRYYMYYGLDFVNQVSVAVSDTPAGKYEFLGNVKHADGTLLGHGENDPFQFDPGALVDDDNRVWLYTGFSPNQDLIDQFRKMGDTKLTAKGNSVVELASDMVTLISEPKPLLPGRLNSEGTGFEGHGFYEASSMRKFNNRYYFIYSSVLSHELAYAVSDYPDRDFVYGGALHSNAGIDENGKATAYWGNNHGSVVYVNGEYYIFGHRQTNYSEASRQGVAEHLEMTSDGHFKMAELTSCGLNDGPLAGVGTYSAGIACQLWSKEGAMKSHEVAIQQIKELHPCITQSGEDREENPDQYIHNLRDGSVAGFKYFAFEQPTEIKVSVRGTGTGTLQVKLSPDDEAVATLAITPSTDWQEVSTTFTKDVNGKQALYFVYNGTESIDFQSFTLN